ncbi:MAG: acetyltransferase, N-acetylglutamate synthase [Pedosphaera sp.]|nr:acetyltransferase, N-acetylglutamate synthase [Pedosphaera sp.]
MNWTLRLAQPADIPSLAELIPLSVRTLQAAHYSPAQIEAALGPVFDVDRQLIADGTYFAVEHEKKLIGCGGWSRRKSFFGGGPESVQPELDPAREPARIRAFFVHPDWARRGIGRGILRASETAILDAGFQRIELVATLAGEPLYASFSYGVTQRYEIETPGGLRLPVVRMGKKLKG